jgi:uspA domain protein
MYSDFSIEEGIIHFTEDHQSDLICMFPAKQSALMHIFNGSISEDIVNHSEKPVLTIKL